MLLSAKIGSRCVRMLAFDFQSKSSSMSSHYASTKEQEPSFPPQKWSHFFHRSTEKQFTKIDSSKFDFDSPGTSYILSQYLLLGCRKHLSSDRSMSAFQWLHLPQVDSTHLFAKQYAQDVIAQRNQVLSESPFRIKALITCDEQLQGVGRRGNAWQSRPGDLLATYLLHSATPWLIEVAGLAALTVTCALFDALTAHLQKAMKDIFIKWPNDLYLGDRKIAGVMVEHLLEQPISLLSVGVNLATRDEQRGDRELSTLALDNKRISSCKLAEQFTTSLHAHLQQLYRTRQNPLTSRHLGSEWVTGVQIAFYFARDLAKQQRGIYRGIDPRGRLVIFWRNRTLFLSSEQICKLEIEKSRS